ncbi:MAG: pyruvate kinase [Planctomycetota bacterium]|nr:pyruvate kinase [Planctomycetota bacterium]
MIQTCKNLVESDTTICVPANQNRQNKKNCMVQIRPRLTEARSKIVATVGPACSDVESLTTLVNEGVDVFRINTAHGKIEDFERIQANIKQARENTGFPVAILLDLAGPKSRLGQLLEDPLEVEPGDELEIVRAGAVEKPNQLCSTYETLVDDVEVGDKIMLADGTITIKVKESNKDSCVCEVCTAGTIRSRQGINLPGVKLSVSAMRPEDIDNALWAAKNDIDFVSLSFVRSAQDVHSLKDLIGSLGSTALVIAKIEKREALECLEEVVEAADGIMVARGDLGVEIDVARTPVEQKRIIRVCREKLKPVIVATQMLESMHNNSRPTRAEASDVANAILDGADACMLSGETAIGKYPVEAVRTMDSIMVHTEQMLKEKSGKLLPIGHSQVDHTTAAVTQCAADVAQSIRSKLVVVVSQSGGTAWVKSKQRNFIHTLGVSNRQDTLRRMCLFWGIMPHYIESFDDTQSLYEQVADWGKERGMLAKGDSIVLVTGTGIIDNTHNQVVVHEIPG